MFKKSRAVAIALVAESAILAERRARIVNAAAVTFAIMLVALIALLMGLS